MIENELSAMPSRKRHENHRQRGYGYAYWKDDLGASMKPQPPVHARDRNQHDCGDSVIPTCGTLANALDQQKLRRADRAGKYAEPEREAAGPKTSAHPERIGAPPVENVAAKRGKNQRDRKSHGHRVNRMPGHRDRGGSIQLFDFLGNRIRHDRSPRLVRLLTRELRFRFSAGIVLPAAFCGGCAGPLSTLEPAGPASASIAKLWWVMLAGGGALFALVIALLLAGFLKPGAGKNLPQNFWLAGGGLMLPALVLTPLMAYAVFSGERLLAHPNATNVVRINVVAELSGWRFSYPDLAGSSETLNVLYLPVGRAVDLRVTSTDVIHSFWVPRLGGKIDAIPGHNNVIRISASQAGIYSGVCAEFCGPPHTTMNFVAEALAQDAFTARMRELGTRK